MSKRRAFYGGLILIYGGAYLALSLAGGEMESRSASFHKKVRDRAVAEIQDALRALSDHPVFRSAGPVHNDAGPLLNPCIRRTGAAGKAADCPGQGRDLRAWSRELLASDYWNWTLHPELGLAPATGPASSVFDFQALKAALQARLGQGDLPVAVPEVSHVARLLLNSGEYSAILAGLAVEAILPRDPAWATLTLDSAEQSKAATLALNLRQMLDLRTWPEALQMSVESIPPTPRTFVCAALNANLPMLVLERAYFGPEASKSAASMDQIIAGSGCYLSGWARAWEDGANFPPEFAWVALSPEASFDPVAGSGLFRKRFIPIDVVLRIPPLRKIFGYFMLRKFQAPAHAL